ncbi:MAG: UDP-3-O-(3-hydroxymyristoyl)glucosamine N-acyltransferase [Thermoguttaceae bacterium]
MQATLGELALLVGGQVVGPENIVVRGAAPLRDALPGHITIADSADRARSLADSKASAAVCPRSFVPEGTPAILVDDVHHAFSRIVSHFHPLRLRKRIGVSRLAAVSPTAVLGVNVDVHPYATIGDDVKIGAGSTIHSGAHIMAGSEIGENVTIFPGAVLYENTVVGERSIIHAAAVLGAYGFGYDQVEGRHCLTAQLGNVIIGADVEIGAGSTIDRGTYGPTVIGDGTKIDDQVMVAHNCQLGRHNMLCSQVGIAGSSTTGDYVVLAGQVGVRDHVHVGSGSIVGAKGGIVNDVPDGSRYIGIPATPEREQKVRLAAVSKLPEMRHQLKALQRTVEKLAEQIAALERSGVAQRPAA